MWEVERKLINDAAVEQAGQALDALKKGGMLVSEFSEPASCGPRPWPAWACRRWPPRRAIRI
jgi:hypothetical protein